MRRKKRPVKIFRNLIFYKKVGSILEASKETNVSIPAIRSHFIDERQTFDGWSFQREGEWTNAQPRMKYRVEKNGVVHYEYGLNNLCNYIGTCSSYLMRGMRDGSKVKGYSITKEKIEDHEKGQC